MKIGVVIPTITPELILEAVAGLEQQTRQPDYVIVCDNSKDGLYGLPQNKWLRVVREHEPLTVNESWNIGRLILRMRDYAADVITFLNDDVVLRNDFLELLELAFKKTHYGVICPNTVKSIDMLQCRQHVRRKAFELMEMREGWAFSVRSEILKDIPLIPANEIKIFCGDDWYWFHCERNRYQWGKDWSNRIYHKVGVSFNGKKNAGHPLLKQDKRAFLKLIAQY